MRSPARIAGYMAHIEVHRHERECDAGQAACAMSPTSIIDVRDRRRHCEQHERRRESPWYKETSFWRNAPEPMVAMAMRMRPSGTRRTLRVGAPAHEVRYPRIRCRYQAHVMKVVGARRRNGLVRGRCGNLGVSGERAPAGGRFDAALKRQARRLPGVAAEASREGFQVGQLGRCAGPAAGPEWSLRQSHHIQRRHGHGAVGAISVKRPFARPTPAAENICPLAEQHPVNAKQLAGRGQKNEYCDGGEPRRGQPLC